MSAIPINVRSDFDFFCCLGCLYKIKNQTFCENITPRIFLGGTVVENNYSIPVDPTFLGCFSLTPNILHKNTTMLIKSKNLLPKFFYFVQIKIIISEQKILPKIYFSLIKFNIHSRIFQKFKTL